jgi:hypothetical protein
MLFRFTSIWIALGLLMGMWGLSLVRRTDERYALQPVPVGTLPGPVRILQFYASVGTLAPGDKALLCYGVENARSVQISPLLANVYPAYSRCVEIGPQRTTHYTITAEGFDGQVATKSFTLPVLSLPASKPAVRYAGVPGIGE